MAEVSVKKLNDYNHSLVPPGPLVIESSSMTSLTSDSYSNSDANPSKEPTPVAICGMATRLPGGISSPEQLWEFLLNKGDGCAPIPAERYTTRPPRGAGAPDDGEKAGLAGSEAPHWKTHGYMLDHVDLAAFDSSLFTMTRAELGIVDPQQRILLELTRQVIS